MKSCYFFGHRFVKVDRRPDTYLQNVCERCSHETNYPARDKYEHTFWDSNTWETIKLFLWVLIPAVIIIFLLVLLNSLTDKASCDAFLNMGIPAKYNFWTGCMAHSEKFGWLPIEQYFNSLNINMP